MIKLTMPLNRQQLIKLKAGDEVFLSGSIYTARDQAHQRMVEAMKKKKKLPVDLKGAVIYYCGPAPAKPKRVIGSAGPTTSGRMDAFTPVLLNKGLLAMIGKGRRSQEVIKSIRKNKAVYFIAPAGCGALLSEKIVKAKSIAYPELGPEAIYKLEVKNFPLIVGVDTRGADIYENRG